MASKFQDEFDTPTRGDQAVSFRCLVEHVPLTTTFRIIS